MSVTASGHASPALAGILHALSDAKQRCSARILERLMFQLTSEQESLPDELRVPVWRLLLDVPADLDEASLTASITDCEMDLPPRNQRTIRVDAERTRADVAAFVTPEMNLRIQKILTYYCKEGWRCRFPRKGVPHPAAAASTMPPVPYKQGLNELLAVFLCLGGGVGALSDGLVLALMARFVSVFAPRIYASEDPDATSLQCSLRLFRLLMQYHLPGVSLLLDQYDVAPELYSTPWLLCLMARGNSMATVLPLWDFLIACGRHPGPALFHCVALAFLASLHPRLVEVSGGPDSSTDLPMVLTRATFFGPKHVRSVAAQAVDYYAETPLSFRRLIAGVCYGSLSDGSRDRAGGGGRASGRDQLAIDEALSIPISSALLSRLDSRLAVKISVAELLVGAGSRLAGSPLAAAGSDGSAEVPGSPASAGSGFCPGFGADAEEDALAAEVNAAAAAAAAAASAAAATAAASGSKAASASASAKKPPAPVASRWKAEPAGFERLLHQRTHLDVPPRYFLLDCRPAPEFEYGGHLPTAFHLDPSLLSDPEALGRLMEGFSGLKGVHFAILGSGNLSQWYHAPQLPPDLAAAAAEAVAAAAAADVGSPSPSPSPRTSIASSGGGRGSLPRPHSGTFAVRKRGSSAASHGGSYAGVAASSSSGSDSGFDEAAAIRSGLAPISADEEDDYASADATRLFLLYFLQKGFLRVSEVEGGFTALHQHQAHFLSSVLVNHDAGLCMVCSGGSAAEKYAAAQAADAAAAGGVSSSGSAAADKRRRGTGGASVSKGAAAGSATHAGSASSRAARPSANARTASEEGSVAVEEEDDERSARLLGAAGSVFAAAATLLKSPQPTTAHPKGSAAGRSHEAAAAAGKTAAAGGIAATVDDGDDDDDDDDVEIALFDPGHGSPAGSAGQKKPPPKPKGSGKPAGATASAGSAAQPTKPSASALPKTDSRKQAGSSAAASEGASVAAQAEPAKPALPAPADSATALSTDQLPSGWVHLRPLHRCDLVEEEDELAVDGFGGRSVPALREWVFLEQQLDELERCADLAARNKAAGITGGLAGAAPRAHGSAALGAPGARPRTGSGAASPAARRGLGLEASGDSPRALAGGPADATARRGSALAAAPAAAASVKPPAAGPPKGASHKPAAAPAPGPKPSAAAPAARGSAPAARGSAPASPGASAAATLDQLGAPINFDETLAAGAVSAARSAKTAAGIAGRALKSIFGPPPPTSAIPPLPRAAAPGGSRGSTSSAHLPPRIHPDDDDGDDDGLEAMEARAEAMLRQRGLSTASGGGSGRASMVGSAGSAPSTAASGGGSSPGLPRVSSAGAGAFVLGRTPGFDAWSNARSGAASGTGGASSPGSSSSSAMPATSAAARRASAMPALAASVISAGAPLPSPAGSARGGAASGRLSTPGGAKV